MMCTQPWKCVCFPDSMTSHSWGPCAVFETEGIFYAPLGCRQIENVRQRLYLCTPLVYSNDYWLKKCGHIRRTRPKNVRPAAEMCAPGAECTLNFEHCMCNVSGHTGLTCVLGVLNTLSASAFLLQGLS